MKKNKCFDGMNEWWNHSRLSKSEKDFINKNLFTFRCKQCNYKAKIDLNKLCYSNSNYRISEIIIQCKVCGSFHRIDYRFKYIDGEDFFTMKAFQIYKKTAMDALLLGNSTLKEL